VIDLPLQTAVVVLLKCLLIYFSPTGALSSDGCFATKIVY